MDSRSVANAPLSSAGADDALDHPASLPQASAPGFRAGSPAHRSRSAIYVFTVPIFAFTMTDLGVHVAPIPAFTIDRSTRSPCAGTRSKTTRNARRASGDAELAVSTGARLQLSELRDCCTAETMIVVRGQDIGAETTPALTIEPVEPTAFRSSRATARILA